MLDVLLETRCVIGKVAHVLVCIELDVDGERTMRSRSRPGFIGFHPKTAAIDIRAAAKQEAEYAALTL